MRPLTPPRSSLRMSALLSVVAGLLVAIGFAPMGVWPGPLLGVGLLTWAVAARPTRRGAALCGLLFGLALNAVTLHWIAVLGTPVAIALVLFMSLWTAVLALGLQQVVRLPWWPVWTAAVWVGVELLAGSVPFGGFPWIRLAHTAIDQPMSGWFAWVGAVGVSLLVALVSHLLLAVVVDSRRRLRLVAAAAAVLVVGGLLNLTPVASPEQSVRVALVQGNVNRAEHGTSTYARSVTANHLSETVFLLAEQRAEGQEPADFIVWPENSTDVDPIADEETRTTVTHAVQLAGVPIFVGAVMDGPDPDAERQTSSLWWSPEEGPGDIYHKRNLVPFGEWIPFRDVLLPRLPILEQIGRQSIPGTGPGVVDAPTQPFRYLRVGTVICFELAWDSTSYDTVRAGADIIVIQSNTNTYAGTFEPPQQMVLNRVRSMELGRETVAATLNGLSGLIDARGRVHGPTAEMTAAHRTFEVPLRHNTNLAVRLSPWLGWVLAVIGAASVVAGVVRGRPGSLE